MDKIEIWKLINYRLNSCSLGKVFSAYPASVADLMRKLLDFRLQMEVLIANTGQIQWERAQLLDFIDSCSFIFNENSKKYRRAVKRIARFPYFARKTDVRPTPVGK